MFFPRIQIGLDVQADGLRCVIGYYRRGRYHLKKLHYQAFPAFLFAHGQVIGWSKITLYLKKLATDLGVLRCPLAIALPFELVKMQKLQLPIGLHHIDIQTEISAQLKRDLPGFQEKLKTDFIISNAQPGTGFNQILFAAVKEEVLKPCLESIQSTGLTLNIVDIDVYALRRALGVSERISVVLQVGMFIRLVIYQKDEIIFYQQQQSNEERMPWLIASLSAIQHIVIEHHFIVGESARVKQVLQEIASISAQNWRVPICSEFLPSGFEIAYGLALRAMQ